MYDVKVRFKPSYKCSVCKRTELGDTVTEEFRCYNVEDISEIVKSRPITSHAMPVGWSYNGAFKCQNCGASAHG